MNQFLAARTQNRVITYSFFADTTKLFTFLFYLTCSVGTNLIHDFTAVTFSVMLAFFRE